MNQDIEVLILAGGKGTRLSSVVSDVPKPMAPIQGRPFLEILICFIRDQGFKNFRLLVGYKAQVIQNHFKDGAAFGVEIVYTSEPYALGTGGSIKKGILESPFTKFLIMNGDTFFETNLSTLVSENTATFSIALRKVEDSARYGQVVIGQDHRVKAFAEKGQRPGAGLINAGVYFFTKDILTHFPPTDVFSVETDVMPRLAGAGKLLGFELSGKFIDIGIPEDFHRAQALLGSHNT